MDGAKTNPKTNQTKEHHRPLWLYAVLHKAAGNM